MAKQTLTLLQWIERPFWLAGHHLLRVCKAKKNLVTKRRLLRLLFGLALVELSYWFFYPHHPIIHDCVVSYGTVPFAKVGQEVIDLESK